MELDEIIDKIKELDIGEAKKIRMISYVKRLTPLVLFNFDELCSMSRIELDRKIREIDFDRLRN